MSGLGVLTEEALEFVDRDQSLTPGRLHCVDRWDDSAVDRGDADAERLRRLFPAVREALDAAGLVELDTADWRASRRRDLMPSCSLSPALTPRPHRTSYTNHCVG